MMMTAAAQTPAAYLADIEELWRCCDELMGSFGPADWSRKHGPDWTFADVPYHLSYFDRDLVAIPIERGTNVPQDEQHVLRTITELDAWNARKFAARPAGQTPQQSLQQMQASRDAVRRVIGQMREEDLERPAFLSLPGTGWLPAGFILEACRGHTWSEFTQLRLRSNRTGPLPNPAVVHRCLGFYMGFFTMMVNRQEAAKQPFTVVMEFTGPAGGAWTFHVANGVCVMSEGRATNVDLAMTQSPDTFIKTFYHIQKPLIAMLTGQIKVRGWMNLGRFGKLFPPPQGDMTLEPIGTATALG